MKPYIGDTTCPKCKTKWKAYSASPKYCDGKKCNRLLGLRIITGDPEHLHLTCPGCGFEWLMECADAEPTKELPADDPVTVYCPVDVDCPHCTERVELAIKIRCAGLERFAVGDKASVDAIVME